MEEVKVGATAHGQRPLRSRNQIPAVRQPFAAVPVNVIDSIVITAESDTSQILAEWIAYDPTITVYSDLRASQATKLFLNWSDRNGTVSLHQGDYFTFVVPDIFIHDYISNATNVPITNEAGEVVATYSIYDNSNNLKEVRITFTDYVENHTNIFGDFWMLLFVGSVASTEQKNLEFIVNDNLLAQGEVTVNPNLGRYTPMDDKVGFSSPTASAGGFYIFEWIVYFNMSENTVNGFHTLEGFSFEDIIPADSPHVFLTNAIRQELGLQPTDFATKIGEYIGADSAPPELRYQVFLNQYNSIDANTWYNFINWQTMTNGLTTTGINGNGGLQIADIEVGDKLFSANLGTVTRPTAIRFYTVSTIQLRESALGDSEVVKLFKNIFNGSYGEELDAVLAVYRFEAGGSAQGITGDYGFAFTKVNEVDAVLPGAMFSLFTSDNFAAGADRFVFSSVYGVVRFDHLPAGTYYLLETTPPYGYLPNDTVYRVVLSSSGFEIYYGPNFEYRLSDIENKVIDTSEFEVTPALVIFPGRKNLIGRPLENGMFSFVVKDSGENAVATGTNNADGSIQFSSIQFDNPGVYVFTVEEVMGEDSNIIYDGSIFSVTVTVTTDITGALIADVTYPDNGIVFNNRYITTSVSVTLLGRKCLSGGSLVGGMFRFVVKDSDGNTVATGTNSADGSIRFSDIVFDEAGVFVFTVEELRGTDSGIIYDSSIFTVTVTVSSDASGNLTAEITYPYGGIVFNNRCVTTTVKPCQYFVPCQPCCNTCCCQTCCNSCGVPHFSDTCKCHV